MITYATVCSGVEGCSLALDGMGWRPIFFSEIEPFPCAVLKHHYPSIPNLGDMSKISYNKETGVITNGSTNIEFRGRLGLLAGGTPCQDFSVAGKRSGAAEGSGTRSSLMWEWLRLAREFKPRVLFWENVVGAFSTNGGRDFHALVRAIDALGYCVAWRVLDAQFTRVDRWPMAIPQRRRRVWLIASLGGDVSEVAKILFESSGIVGDTPPRRISREEITSASQDGHRVYAPLVGDTIALDGDKLKPREDQRKGGNGFGINEDNVGYTLTCPDRHGCAYGIGNGQYANACRSHRFKEVSRTLDCMDDPQKIMQVCSTGKDVASNLSADDCTFSGQDYKNNSVIEAYKIPSMASNVMKSANPETGVRAVDVASTLDTTTPTPQKAQGGDMVVGAIDMNGNSPGWANGVIEKSPDNKQMSQEGFSAGSYGTFKKDEVSGTLDCTHSASVGNGSPCLVVEGAEKKVECFDRSTRARNPESNGDLSPTLLGFMGTGGGNEPIVTTVEGVDGYNKYITGDVSATISGSASDIHHTHGVIVKNSNGGDVMPTINANESKQGGDNQHINGGGYIVHELFDPSTKAENEASNATN